MAGGYSFGMSQKNHDPPKKALPKRLIRLSLWLVAAVITVFALQVGLLAFPQLLLSNKAESGSVVVYYDGHFDPGVQQLVNDTDYRLRAGGFGDPENPERIFFFRDQGEFVILGGYVAFVMGARHPELFAGVIPMGAYTDAAVAIPESEGRLPRYYVAVGDQDEVLEGCRASAAQLTKAGLTVRLRIFEGVGHSFPPGHDSELRRALKFVLK